MSGFLLRSVCARLEIELPTISWDSVMVLRGMAQTHLDDLAERFKRLNVGQAGNANIQLLACFLSGPNVRSLFNSRTCAEENNGHWALHQH